MNDKKFYILRQKFLSRLNEYILLSNFDDGACESFVRVLSCDLFPNYGNDFVNLCADLTTHLIWVQYYLQSFDKRLRQHLTLEERKQKQQKKTTKQKDGGRDL